MRVLIAGASGFLGRAAVRAFVAGGHAVRGLIRTPAQADRVTQDGGEPIRGDLRDPASLDAAVEGSELVVHLAQASDGSLEERRSVRVDGGRNLFERAARAGARRFLVGSGYWVYRDGLELLDEESPLDPRSISRVNWETEQVAGNIAESSGIDCVVARPGMVYGPGSWFQEMVHELRAGEYWYVGDGLNYMSPVELDDAGGAFRVLGERGLPGAVYLVVDDHPVTVRGFAEYVAQRLGVPLPNGRTIEEATAAWGSDLVALNRASRRASNARLRGLGWKPRYPSFRDGLSGPASSWPP